MQSKCGGTTVAAAPTCSRPSNMGPRSDAPSRLAEPVPDKPHYLIKFFDIHCTAMYLSSHEAEQGTGRGILGSFGPVHSFGGRELWLRHHSTGEGIVRRQNRMDG